MGFRFRKSFGLLPGVRVNLSGSGPSVSFGTRGLRYTVGRKGARTTVGIPGTGLSWTNYERYRTPHPPASPISTEPIVSNPIESEAGSVIGARSTHELAPVLSALQRRLRFSPIFAWSTPAAAISGLLTGRWEWLALAVIIGGLFWPASLYVDKLRRSVKVKYLLSDDLQGRFQALVDGYTALSGCQKAWQVFDESYTNDWKRNAGTKAQVQRRDIKVARGQPRYIVSDFSLPAIVGKKTQLYFAPDAVLIVAKSEITALNYNDLSISSATIRFVEDGSAPSDTQIVGTTWRYVNKSGGPDRRFSGNSQLPVCLYGELNFMSASGLNEKYECSQANAASKFATAFRAFQTEIPVTPGLTADQTISLSKMPSNWLSGVPITLLCLAALAAVLIQQNILPTQRGLLPSPTTSADNPSSVPPPNNKTNRIAPAKTPAPSDSAKNLAPSDAPAKNPTSNDKPPLLPKSQKVQQRLIDLGYLKGQADGVWGLRSSSALAEFRASVGQTKEDVWDENTQSLLFSSTTVARAGKFDFVGGWANNATECTDPSDIPLTITPQRAVTLDGSACNFANLQKVGNGWRTDAVCVVAGTSRKVSIDLTVAGNQLVWRSASGSNKYVRCN